MPLADTDDLGRQNGLQDVDRSRDIADIAAAHRPRRNVVPGSFAQHGHIAEKGLRRFDRMGHGEFLFRWSERMEPLP
jgi:hypothetical protein